MTLQRREPPAWRSLGIAVGSVGVATLLRGLLTPLWDENLPYFTFYPTVIVAAWFGGLVPGLVATGLSALAARYFWLYPFSSLAPPDLPDAVGLGLFVGINVFISALVERLHRAMGRAAAEVVEKAEARAETEAARQRFAFLAEASAVLSSSLEYATTLGRVARLAVPFLADYCVIDVFEQGGEMRRVAVAHADPAKEPLVNRLRDLPPVPHLMRRVARVLSTGEPDVVPVLDLPRAAAAIADPERRAAIVALGPRSYVVVALKARERTLGTMTFVFAESGRRYGEGDVALAQELAGRAAVALDNALLHEAERRARAEAERARAAAEEAERRAALLAEASVVLSSTLDYERTLGAVARLVVPRFADWCAVDVVDEAGVIRRVATADQDPERERVAWGVEQRYQLSAAAPYGPPRVIRDGKPELFPELPADFRTALARDPEHRVLQQFPLASYVCVPLSARGRVLGAITLVSTRAERRYADDDLAFAEELARRAALAIDNARLYEAERRARAEAEDANRAKDEFLSTVSHELRTPLQAMLGWVGVLRQGKLNEARTARAIEIIERSGRAQARLIGDLLDVSRIVTGRLPIELRPVDLPPVIQAALDAIRPAAVAKQVRLACLLDPSVRSVTGDPDRLQQIVWNLLSNAVKFTPSGGRVEVRIERDPGAVRVVVTDTGEGIAPEFLPHVFERFRQAEGTRSSRRQGGLGLGLAIVRHLVELHGGRVHVASPGVGQGATFTVVLPLTPDAMSGEESLAGGGRSTDVEHEEHPRRRG